jgi:hypothetical protein
VYKDLVKILTHLSLEVDPEELKEVTEAMGKKKSGASGGPPSGQGHFIVKCVCLIGIHLLVLVLTLFQGTQILKPIFAFSASRYSLTTLASSTNQECERFSVF